MATLSVLFFTVALTLLQIAFPDVRLALWRDEAGLESGEVWRLVSPLLIQYDPPADAVMVLVLIGVVGTAVERVFGPVRWLAIYLACGVLGQAFGYLWNPADAGCSVAGAGLLGALSAWVVAPSTEAPAPPRIVGVGVALGGIALTVARDMHGPPLLLGCMLGAALVGRR